MVGCWFRVLFQHSRCSRSVRKFKAYTSRAVVSVTAVTPLLRDVVMYSRAPSVPSLRPAKRAGRAGMTPRDALITIANSERAASVDRKSEKPLAAWPRWGRKTGIVPQSRRKKYYLCSRLNYKSVTCTRIIVLLFLRLHLVRLCPRILERRNEKYRNDWIFSEKQTVIIT
jgi:hypothetical protein